MITPNELRSFKTQLLSLIERFDKDIVQLQAEARQIGRPDATPPLASDPVEDGETRGGELDLALLEREQDLAEECNAALARLEDGSFGKCEDCKKPISKPRLKAIPYTRFCMECARLREHERR